MVAGGPSASACDLAAARGRARVIVVNDGWRLAPWADVLYACDHAWWRLQKGVPAFEGLKLSQDANACAAWQDVFRVSLLNEHRLLTDTPGEIGSGGNSGFQAVNMAVQFGAARIVLVGFDYRIDQGLHWHGKHPPGLNNPTQLLVAHWRERLDGQAARLRDLGVEVVNVSLESALAAFPKVSIQEALR